MSCRGSTLKNYKTSKSSASIDIIFLLHDRTEEDLITASSCMCIKSNLEDVAKKLNDHAANSVHFPPKKNGPCLNERIDIIMKSYERSCVLFFKILLEYQFFSEMLKQVRGSMNDYEDTLV